MDLSERLHFCKKCSNRMFDGKIGLVCSITSQKPDFEGSCNSFSEDSSVNEHKHEMELMSEMEDKKLSYRDVVAMVLMIITYIFILSKVIPLIDASDEDAAIVYFLSALFINSSALAGIRNFQALKYSFWISCLMYLSVSLIAYLIDHYGLLIPVVYAALTFIFFPVVYFILVNPKRKKIKKIKKAILEDQ